MPSRVGTEDPGAGYPYREHARRLASALDVACADALARRSRVAVAFSGGLDSALLAMLCARHSDVRLYVAGKRGCHDFRAAASAAERLSLPIATIEIEPESLGGVARRVASAMESPAPIEVAVAVPMAFVCAAAGEDAVVTGTGADELFGGYARYGRMTGGARLESMMADLARLRIRGARTEAAIGAMSGKALLHPYLAKAVEGIARDVGAGGHFWNGTRKSLLREAALVSGLPPALADRPKKAAQYGSGVARMLARASGNGRGAGLRKGY